MNEKLYDSKKALLKSTFKNESVLLHDALAACAVEFNDNGEILDEISDKEVEALIQRSIQQDTDNGPISAWKSEHRYLPPEAWVMAGYTTGLRERAYVLWDNDRMDKYCMLELYGSVPEVSSHMCHEDEFSNMQKSFEDRSQIWRKGGRGYWSPKDTSRIEW